MKQWGQQAIKIFGSINKSTCYFEERARVYLLHRRFIYCILNLYTFCEMYNVQIKQVLLKFITYKLLN